MVSINPGFVDSSVAAPFYNIGRDPDLALALQFGKNSNWNCHSDPVPDIPRMMGKTKLVY